MSISTLHSRQRGQGMTEYIIIVALIAIAAIGVYKAFGGVVRGQTSVAASSLAGVADTDGRKLANSSQKTAKAEATVKTLADFEKQAE